ncbi:TPA: 23S rRNA methyltransferase [Streptococcus suis]
MLNVETVVLLSQQKPSDRIKVELDLDKLDATSAETKATYAEIKDYVLKEHGLKVSNLYISQVKRKCGLEVGENYNLPKSEDAKQPNCTEEKDKAIKDALDHFGMV